MRDRFAMAALQGMCANHIHNGEMAAYARDAYRLADAALAARGVSAPQPASDAVARETLRALKALHRWADSQVCRHEETHRAGLIWEICDQCGARWADDQGGKPRFELPDCIVDAEFAIAAAEKEQSA